MDKLIELVLVEDNPLDAELALRAFQRDNLPINITLVRDGEEALNYLCADGHDAHLNPAKKPDIILLDLKLPKVDGIDVLRIVKNDHRTKLIPVIILTSSCQEKDINQCYLLGANSYIVKPVDFDDFLEVIRKLGHYWVSLNCLPPSH